MNKFKYLSSAMMLALTATSLTSCDDWTEPENVDYIYSTVEDSENYPAYLESIRAYRASDHKKVYAWIDLSAETPGNQSQRVTSLPDSIDVLVLSNRSDWHPTVVEDLEMVRNEKGMKVIYEIDFDAIKAEHTLICEEINGRRDAVKAKIAALDPEAADYQAKKSALEKELEAIVLPDFNDHVLNALSENLKYVAERSLDGVIFAFDGKATTHLNPAELTDYRAKQLVFMGAALDWHKRNPEKTCDFMGKPQNITDPDMLKGFDMIFVRQGLDATNANIYTYYLNLALTEGVPAERVGMMATYKSPDSNDATTGVFSDGSVALAGFAKWLVSADVACVGLKNVQNDYFNPNMSYPHVRKVIQAANPSIK